MDVCLGKAINVTHVHVGEREVNIACKGLVLAEVVQVDNFGDEVAGEGDDKGIGDDRDPAHKLHDTKPDANAVNLLSNWPPGRKRDNYVQ